MTIFHDLRLVSNEPQNHRKVPMWVYNIDIAGVVAAETGAYAALDSSCVFCRNGKFDAGEPPPSVLIPPGEGVPHILVRPLLGFGQLSQPFLSRHSESRQSRYLDASS